jgi:hypothetical protein
VDQVGVLHGFSQTILQVLLKDFYLPGWIQGSRGVDQVIIALIYSRNIENLMALKEPDDKTRMFRTLLKGQSLKIISGGGWRQKNQSSLTNHLIDLVLRYIGLEYISKHAICVQKYYMRQPRGLYMGFNMSVLLKFRSSQGS